MNRPDNPPKTAGRFAMGVTTYHHANEMQLRRRKVANQISDRSEISLQIALGDPFPDRSFQCSDFVRSLHFPKRAFWLICATYGCFRFLIPSLLGTYTSFRRSQPRRFCARAKARIAFRRELFRFRALQAMIFEVGIALDFEELVGR